jgi:pimeloyl-ACP methyl ester carboxylesterase
MEEPINFKNRNNESLFGILHHPKEDGKKNVSVIMLNSGTNNRVGWHRFNVKIARVLTQVGFHVLRYDAHGIGYSEGILSNTEDLHVIHDAIETGLLSPDVYPAVDYIQKRLKPKKIFALGQCGGALTGIIAAGRDKRISGLAYLAGPVVMATSEKTLHIHPRDAELQFRGYIRRFFNFKAWWRFLSFKSDYKAIYHIFKIRIQELINKKSLISDIGNDFDFKKKTKKSGLVINKEFLNAFKIMMKDKRRILFIMPTLDRASWSFKNMFQEHYLKPGNHYEPYHQIIEIPRCNHTFSHDENQTDVIRLLKEWFIEMATQ